MESRGGRKAEERGKRLLGALTVLAAVLAAGCGGWPSRESSAPGPGPIMEERTPITMAGQVLEWPQAQPEARRPSADHTVLTDNGGDVQVEWGDVPGGRLAPEEKAEEPEQPMQPVPAEAPPEGGTEEPETQQPALDEEETADVLASVPAAGAHAGDEALRDSGTAEGAGMEAVEPIQVAAAEPAGEPLGCLEALEVKAERETRDGERLAESLRRWLRPGGWKLQIETTRTWRNKAGAELAGSLREAIDAVMNAWGQNALPSPTLKAYGNCVMVLSDNEKRR